MKRRPPRSDQNRTSFKKAFPLIFILVIMVLSIFGVVFFGVPTPETFEYKDLTFIQGSVSSQQGFTNSGYITTVNEQKYTFLYDPRNLEDLNIASITLTQLRYASKFYVSANPEDDISYGVSEFNRLLAPLIGKRMNSACTEDVPSCGDLLIKTCEDATPEAKVIVYEINKEPKVTYALNCLKFQGSAEDLGKLTNKLALNFLINTKN